MLIHGKDPEAHIMWAFFMCHEDQVILPIRLKPLIFGPVNCPRSQKRFLLPWNYSLGYYFAELEQW